MKVALFDKGHDFVALELTRRNLIALLRKLDYNAAGGEPRSHCTILDPSGVVQVRAVEDSEHYSDRDPGLMLDNATGEMT